jgi:hypothetical protein
MAVVSVIRVGRRSAMFKLRSLNSEIFKSVRG